jgi:uncharacterized protein YceH (UPF0502 family)
LGAVNTLPELRNAEQIGRMPSKQKKGERNYPMRLRGVITFFDQKGASRNPRVCSQEPMESLAYGPKRTR